MEPYNLERVDRCPIDIYVASNMPYPYPYKLGKPRHASQKIRDSCETWIMDSGIGDDTTNKEVLDLAEKYDADFVVACDELHDQEATTESVLEFMDLHDDHDCRATPLIPLQPPHDEHYRELEGFGAYVLGGVMKKKWYSNSEVENLLHCFRREAGYGPYVHLLGRGGSMDIVRAVASTPGLIQSLDCSTPEQAAKNGAILDSHLKQRPIEIMTGKGSSAGRYDLAQKNTLQINDAYTKSMRSETTTLASFAGAD